MTLCGAEMVNKDTKVLIHVLMPWLLRWLLWIRLAHHDLRLAASTGGQPYRGSQEHTRVHTHTPFFLFFFAMSSLWGLIGEMSSVGLQMFSIAIMCLALASRLSQRIKVELQNRHIGKDTCFPRFI